MYFLGERVVVRRLNLCCPSLTALAYTAGILYNPFPKKNPKMQYRAFFVAIVGIDLIRFSFLSLSWRVTKPTLLLPSLFSELPLLCGVRRPGFKICNISSGKKRTRIGEEGSAAGRHHKSMNKGRGGGGSLLFLLSCCVNYGPNLFPTEEEGEDREKGGGFKQRGKAFGYKKRREG